MTRVVAIEGGARGARDDGAVALLILVDVVVAAALVLTVTAATGVHLARGRLLAVADAAALDAADALDDGSFYTGGASPTSGVPLSDASVRTSVTAYLAAAGAPEQFGDLAVDSSTGSPDGRTAEVTLTARVALPLLPAAVAHGWAAGVPIAVTSRARAGLVAP